MPRDEVDPNPTICNNVLRGRAEEACVVIQESKAYDQEEKLPEVQPELSVQQPSRQPGADYQDGDPSCRVHPGDSRLVNVELPILEGMFAMQVRYPCSGLPPRHEQTEHDDQNKNPRDDRRPRPQSDGCDPCIRELLDE